MEDVALSQKMKFKYFSIETAAREGYTGQLLPLNILESLNPRNSYPRIFKEL